MARRWTWFWLGCWCTLVAVGQAPCTLRVSDGVVAVPGATVWLNGRPVGATNASGEWTWDQLDGRIDIRALGFNSVEVEGEAGCPAEFCLWCCPLRRMNLEAQQWSGA